jgi:signal transduction histidine kinase
MVVAVEEQSALLRVAMLVARGMRLEELFAHVCEESARLLGIDATGVLRYIGGERAVVVGVWRTGGARGLPVNAELDFHHSDSAIGRALATKAPARVSNYDHARGELPAVMRSMGMSASVATPVLVDGEPWGAIVATAVDEDALPSGCEQRLSALAELVAQAVANERRWEELAASRMRLLEAGDETRRRLESGLHEGAHQHVVALALKLRVALGRADPASEEAEVLRDALADAMEASAELSELARGLHPAVLEHGLGPALDALATRSKIPTTVRCDVPSRLPEPVELAAYFVACEALTNVAKYADASTATVRAWSGGGRATIEISDDGVGGADDRRGSGLRGLADRVEALDGRLRVLSPAGGGTVVTAELPCAGRSPTT